MLFECTGTHDTARMTSGVPMSRSSKQLVPDFSDMRFRLFRKFLKHFLRIAKTPIPKYSTTAGAVAGRGDRQ